MLSQKEQYVSSRYHWPQRLDVLTLLISVSLLVSTIVALIWLASVCYRKINLMRLRGGRGETKGNYSYRSLEHMSSNYLEESSMDLESRTASQIKNEMDYLGDEDTTESVPLDWRIERPDHLRSYRRTSSRDPRQPRQPIFSDRDVDKTVSLDDAEKGVVSSRRKEEKPQTRPVLNVIWEKSMNECPRHKTPAKILNMGERQLISSTPVIVRKPKASGHGHVDEPMVVNLYYEPSGPGEYIEVSKGNLEVHESRKAASGDTDGPVLVVSPENVPYVTVTTTKTRTRVSEPSPGYMKKVVDTRTRTKEVRRKALRDRDRKKVLPSRPAEAPSVETGVEIPIASNKSPHRLSETETAISKTPTSTQVGTSLSSVTTPTLTTSTAPGSTVAQPQTQTLGTPRSTQLKEDTTQTTGSSKIY
ncbi:hypothetical protein OESDEN_10367 [Oesophagostomum dentatum]|uniref:Uncharacterized protein n=1 Tax=Oesophagostomum dentatum TaxID=61180 RepID=A0A0B1SWW7_OESDE|nr:hypothetical protein OESDEN_10367 [Oesophagostomum dentatum]